MQPPRYLKRFLTSSSSHSPKISVDDQPGTIIANLSPDRHPLEDSVELNSVPFLKYNGFYLIPNDGKSLTF
jgi:hypothetical protein